MARVFIYGPRPKVTADDQKSDSTANASTSQARKPSVQKDCAWKPSNSHWDSSVDQQSTNAPLQNLQNQMYFQAGSPKCDPFITLSILLTLTSATLTPNYQSGENHLQKKIKKEDTPIVLVENLEMKKQTPASVLEMINKPEKLNEELRFKCRSHEKIVSGDNSLKLDPKELEFDMDSNLDLSIFDSDDASDATQFTLVQKNNWSL